MGTAGDVGAGLLTAADEVRLALQIEAGVLAEAALEAGGVAGASTAELVLLAAEGGAAWRRFIEANLGLARLVSQQAAARAGCPPADVFQEACLGLVVAVQRFDCRRGFRFGTYAWYWIQAHAVAATARFGDADLSTGRAAQRRSVRFVEGGLSQSLGRQPTVADVAAATGRPERWVGELLAHRPPEPLDVGVGETPAVADPGSVGDGAADAAAALLDRLGPGPGRQVLQLRLGFTTGTPMSYVAVARRLQLSVARVRRIEQGALEELRSCCTYDAALGG